MSSSWAQNSKLKLDSADIDFGRQIQPILSENCYFCHGQDEAQRQADLRLDDRESTLALIEPGKPDDSELIRRLLSDDVDEQMPPPDSHRKLTSNQIDLLRRWVEQGAMWGQHWAFESINKRADFGEDRDALNPIDFFVKRKLAVRGWKLSPVADRLTLIRRVSLDLTGLPPTPAEVQQFVEDKRPNAYERMVDRYLASPAFGERMAWNWLDAARYADTNGYQGDNERTMWPWRDWVVRAYNQNMPFDQFSTWQLAGDLMPEATDEQILATGFLRNHPINGEGGRIAEENRVDYVMDMAETTGTVWLGLTFNCCRCHDHKYDRLTQRDYYSFFAYFNQTPINGGGGNAQTPPVLDVPSPKQQQEQAKLQQSIANLETQLKQRTSEFEGRLDAKLANVDAPDSSHWSALMPIKADADHAELKILKDGSIHSTGELADNDIYTVELKVRQGKVTGFRLQAIRPSGDSSAVGRSSSGNFVLTGFEVVLKRPGQPDQPVKLSAAEADFSQQSFSPDATLDGKNSSGWAIYRKGKDRSAEHEIVFRLQDPVIVADDSKLVVTLKHQSKHARHLLSRFRLSSTSIQTPSLSVLPYDLATAIAIPQSQRNEAQQQAILRFLMKNDVDFLKLDQLRTSQQKQLAKVNRAIPKVMVMRDRVKYRPTFRLDRGSYENPLDEVQARTPAFFSFVAESSTQADPKQTERPNRLALAKWLFHKDNPLTARVAVNRVWAIYFGTGLVKTSEDFGVQGEPPSHPELLDYLAAEYRDSGWDTKHMVRLILTSQTYRQSAKLPPHAAADPENRLLSRASRFRLPSWMIRDQALAAGGQLHPQMGGPPVNSYQPGGVWEEASFGKKKFQLGQGDELNRRTLYTFWRRIAPPTGIFDNADRMTCSVKRYLTNTPLHALATLNDTTYVEAARWLATCSWNEFQTDAQRLDFMFRKVVVRAPRASEQKVLLTALERTRKQFAENPEAAKALIENGMSQPDTNIEPVELASWTSVGLAILNLDETLTRQ
ncbi:MAG: PSD1 and planctomycete cytochrome C domain-containing protein [Planctomycetota bacterium]